MSSFNFYCDESTHLENDKMPFLVLGAIKCPTEKARDVAVRLREIRVDHGHKPAAEAKWTRIAPANLRYYLALVDYFFDDDDLSFRAVAAQKDGLDHARHGQSHDDWYYKMYFLLLRRLIDPAARNYIYLDVKDTRSAKKQRKLQEILANALLDFDRERVSRLQAIRSHESALLQLADILIGAVNYANRGLDSSQAKLAVVDRVRERSGYRLTDSTLLSEAKFNLFRWRPQSTEDA